MCALRRYPTTTKAQPESSVQYRLGAVVLDRDRINSLVRYLRSNGGSGVQIYSGDGLNKRYVQDLDKSTIDELKKVKITVRNPAITVRFGPSIALISIDRPSAKANALATGIRSLTAQYQYPIILYRQAATVTLLAAVWAAALIGMHYNLTMWVDSFCLLLIVPTVTYPLVIVIATTRRIKSQGIARIKHRAPVKNSAFTEERSLHISMMTCAYAMVIAFVVANIVVWRVTGYLF